MANNRKIFGSNPFYAIQPNREITEKNDGTLEASVVFECDASKIGYVPLLYSYHPDDMRLRMFERKKSYLRNGKAAVFASYFGLQSDPTPPVIQFPGATGREPITTHPDFLDFTGFDPDNPTDSSGWVNGAKFSTSEEDLGQFLGFLDPSGGTMTDSRFNKYGLQTYITPVIEVNLSYWTWKKPKIRKLGKIDQNVEKFYKPANVKNFLLVGMPYREIGQAYQVTENYLGSGEAGWDEEVYG
jgi:hypothetical protein